MALEQEEDALSKTAQVQGKDQKNAVNNVSIQVSHLSVSSLPLNVKSTKSLGLSEPGLLHR